MRKRRKSSPASSPAWKTARSVQWSQRSFRFRTLRARTRKCWSPEPAARSSSFPKLWTALNELSRHDCERLRTVTGQLEGNAPQQQSGDGTLPRFAYDHHHHLGILREARKLVGRVAQQHLSGDFHALALELGSDLFQGELGRLAFHLHNLRHIGRRKLRFWHVRGNHEDQEHSSASGASKLQGKTRSLLAHGRGIESNQDNFGFQGFSSQRAASTCSADVRSQITH